MLDFSFYHQNDNSRQTGLQSTSSSMRTSIDTPSGDFKPLKAKFFNNMTSWKEQLDLIEFSNIRKLDALSLTSTPRYVGQTNN
jgi:hypothetical protein